METDNIHWKKLELLLRSSRSMGDHHHQQQRNGGANGLDLPPGFWFHPSGEELITSYLRPRVLDHNFTDLAIGEADVNNSELWELPLIANMGEKEWYFYCRNDRKYPTGHRANRVIEAGYWKAIGKDKEIYHGESTGPPMLVGMKKILVFYEGRAPKGVKTNWVMHEYKLPYYRVWAVCRVFRRCSGIKKTLESIPLSEPEYHMATCRDNNVDLRSMSFPMPTVFPNEPEDFTMDSSASYSTNCMSLELPVVSPMAGMSSMGLQMNTSDFGDIMATTEPMSFYQQIGSGTSSAHNFMDEPDNMPTSMLSDGEKVNPNQTNAAQISSVVTAVKRGAKKSS